MRIAIAGTRGIPARYGGFETFAEELSTRLKQRGHSVVVYGRRSFFKDDPDIKEYEGVKLRYAPTIMSKYFETVVASFSTFFSMKRREFDIVLLCNAANSPVSWIGRLKGIPILINVDGVERKRAKWNSFGKLWYKLGELSTLCFASRIISDAEVIAQYYRDTYNAETEVIAYGASAQKIPPGEVLKKFNLSTRNYILYVSRLEPENNALGVIRAYNASGLHLPLVIVGDAPYADEYKKQLHAEAGPGVVFTGYQFGDAYHELQSNCSLYIQATEVGGTHPALIEAMAHGNVIIANGTPENREVLNNCGEFYPVNDFVTLSQIMKSLLSAPAQQEQLRVLAKLRAETLYSWERITDQYEELFNNLIGYNKAMPLSRAA